MRRLMGILMPHNRQWSRYFKDFNAVEEIACLQSVALLQYKILFAPWSTDGLLFNKPCDEARSLHTTHMSIAQCGPILTFISFSPYRTTFRHHSLACISIPVASVSQLRVPLIPPSASFSVLHYSGFRRHCEHWILILADRQCSRERRTHPPSARWPLMSLLNQQWWRRPSTRHTAEAHVQSRFHYRI